MTLVYRDEYILDPKGMPHVVLDMVKSDFKNDPTRTFGTKTSPTFAFRGQKNQLIITSQGDNIETFFVCTGGEVVFCDILPDGTKDIYVPRDKQGNPTGAEILKNDYTPIAGNLDAPKGGLFGPNPKVTPILLEVIKQPTAIKDAYGPGQHVFLSEDATLKVAGKSVSGVNPIAFTATWAVTDEHGNITRPARPPSPSFYRIESFERALKL